MPKGGVKPFPPDLHRYVNALPATTNDNNSGRKQHYSQHNKWHWPVRVRKIPFGEQIEYEDEVRLCCRYAVSFICFWACLHSNASFYLRRSYYNNKCGKIIMRLLTHYLLFVTRLAVETIFTRPFRHQTIVHVGGSDGSCSSSCSRRLFCRP